MTMRISTTSSRQAAARQLAEAAPLEARERLLADAPIRLGRPPEPTLAAALRSLLATSTRGHLRLTDRRLLLLRVRMSGANEVYDIPRSLIRAVEPAGDGYLRLVCDAPGLPPAMTGIKAGLGAAAAGLTGGLGAAGAVGATAGAAGATIVQGATGAGLASILIRELNGSPPHGAESPADDQATGAPGLPGGSAARTVTDLAVASILGTLDEAARTMAFPMLDNGYVYLAAARLSLHRSDVDWAVVFEIFGYSPRSGTPDLSVWSIGSRLGVRKPSEQETQPSIRTNGQGRPHDDSAFFWPLDDAWLDPEDSELVAREARVVRVRGRAVPIPTHAGLRANGIEPVHLDRTAVFELCRYLAAVERDLVLGTRDERLSHVRDGLVEVLVLDDWHHPDTAGGELPSGTTCFRSIARVLATGDPAFYDSSEPGNSHWSNWPMGGTL